jgi:DNA repair protein RadC
VGLPGENAVQVAQRLLQKFKGTAGLHRIPFDELVNEHGIGEAKAAQIKAAIELGYRVGREMEKGRSLPTINSPQDAYHEVKHEMQVLEQEELRVMLLDTRNHVLDTVEVYHGSVNSSQVRVAEVFKPAIRRGAPAIIVIHNHPSGDPTPSPDDVAVTRAIVQVGKLMDIEVLDHLVIGQGGFVSLKERGLGF